MSKIVSAYDTLACRGFVVSKTVEAIARCIVDGHYHNYDGLDHNYGSIRAISHDSHAAIVPAFVHPFVVEMNSVLSEPVSVVIDCRASTTDVGYLNELPQVKNQPEFSFATLYGYLTNAWAKGLHALIRDVSPYATYIYSSWISENVSRRYALTPREQMDLSILAAIYYQCLFSDNDVQMSERDVNGLVSTVSRAIRVKATDVYEFIERNQIALPIAGVEQFCALAKTSIGSVRLNDFNAGVLFTCIGNTWFGTHAKEIMAAAVEYPPAFLAVMVTTMTERSYRNANIAKITERVKPQEVKVIIAALERLLMATGR